MQAVLLITFALLLQAEPDNLVRTAIEKQKDRSMWFQLHSKEAENEKRFANLQRRSESEKKKVEATRSRRRNERREFWDEFLKAFRFKLIERKSHNGRPTTVVGLVPNSAYKPYSVVDTQYLPKVEGKLWLDEADKEIARIEVEFIKDVSAGFGLGGKVYKGTRYSMDLTKQFENQWLPARAETELRQRTFLFKEHETFTVEFGPYRRFSTEVKFETLSQPD